MNSFFSRLGGSGTGFVGAAFLVIATTISLVDSPPAVACPFCTAESQTLSEETQTADAVVLAKLLKEAEPTDDANRALGEYDPNAGTATFEIIEVLRGGDALAGVKEIQVVYFGDSDRERVFLITGLGTERIDWMTPLPLSPAAVDYVRKLGEVPATGAERLAFFQEYLENDDPLLAQDAYDEFARAPYADVHALGPKMQHDRLVKWISRPGNQPQPAAAVSHDARRVRHERRRAAAGVDDRVRLQGDEAALATSGANCRGAWAARSACRYGSIWSIRTSAARSWGSMRSWPATSRSAARMAWT